MSPAELWESNRRAYMQAFVQEERTRLRRHREEEYRRLSADLCQMLAISCGLSAVTMRNPSEAARCAVEGSTWQTAAAIAYANGPEAALKFVEEMK